MEADKKTIKVLELELEKIKAENEAILKIQDIQDYHIKAEAKEDISEATAFIVLSDWHCEEKVKSSSVNGLNSFSLKIAEERINTVFRNSLKVYSVLKKDISIPNIVIGLLGDFISSNIHEELLENTSLRPIEAIIWVQEKIKAGIEYLLKNTDAKFTIVCSSGNHARITKKTHISNASGNSLEFFMYNNLKNNIINDRVKWIVNDSYHTYLKVYNYTIRFHHGDAMRFLGGISGIFLPAYKSISQWNKAKKADFDIFGHFHQMKDGGNFLCNGSLIGWNAYAINIKADFEMPSQAFFLLDKKHGKTITTKIYLN